MHRLNILTSALCSFLFLPTVGDCAVVTFGPVEWSIASGGNGHAYALVMPNDGVDNFSWTEANAAAQATFHLGSQGHLATVTSAAENAFLETNFASHLRIAEIDFAWIGLTDVDQEGVYKWVTGEPFSYSNWASTEPNNLGNEDYIHYWRRDGLFQWNDVNDFQGLPDTFRGYFVEYDGPFQSAVPEPSTAVSFLVGLGAFAFAAHRVRKHRRLKS